MFPLTRVPFWYRFFEPQPYGCGCQNQWDHFGLGAPPILGPILVVGLGGSLGVRDFDPWPYIGGALFVALLGGCTLKHHLEGFEDVDASERTPQSRMSLEAGWALNQEAIHMDVSDQLPLDYAKKCQPIALAFIQAESGNSS